MIIVDTSVWIELFRDSTDLDLESVVDLEEVVTCLPVIQEVLQGLDDQRAYNLAREAMHALPIVESPLNADTYHLAIDLYRSTRRAGLTIRSSVDCLIAACALRNSLPVLHRDRDFDTVARVASLSVRRLGEIG